MGSFMFLPTSSGNAEVKINEVKVKRNENLNIYSRIYLFWTTILAKYCVEPCIWSGRIPTLLAMLVSRTRTFQFAPDVPLIAVMKQVKPCMKCLCKVGRFGPKNENARKSDHTTLTPQPTCSMVFLLRFFYFIFG